MRFRFALHTFGCQMNVHDSDRMAGVLRAAGGVEVDRREELDLLVLNTCSVREKAEQKLRSEVGRLAALKHERPDMVVAVAGCVAAQEGEALLDRMPLVDLVVGPDNVAELPGLLSDQWAGAPPTVRTEHDLREPRFLPWTPPPSTNGEPRAPAVALVTTMKGCDERCSFCIVPYTRGPERYRPAAEIIDEVARFVAAGSREVLLLGQTVDSFRDPAFEAAPEDEELDNLVAAAALDPQRGRVRQSESQFSMLLRAIAREVPSYRHESPAATGLARLRYTSPHPRHATASLARAHRDLDVLARHVHLPVQSGSDRVLRRMVRRYTRAEYVARAARLMRARSGITLSTDIIVGFPGETEDDFEQTLSLVREVGFVSLFGFKYSPRPHTAALKLKDDVAEAVKSQRLARLFEVGDALAARHLSSLVGTTQRVLVEGISKGQREDRTIHRVQGRTERNEIVHIDAGADEHLVGCLVDVRIIRAHGHSLAGELLASPPPLMSKPAPAQRNPLHLAVIG